MYLFEFLTLILSDYIFNMSLFSASAKLIKYTEIHNIKSIISMVGFTWERCHFFFMRGLILAIINFY